MQNENNNFVHFTNTETKKIDIPLSLILNLPELYLTNSLLNPYSNITLGIPEGEGYLDQLIEQTDNVNRTTKLKTINTSDTRAYVKQWLMQNENLTNELASALTGVWFAESRLNPAIHEIGKENNPYAGKGIAQWTGRLRLKHVEDIYKRLYGKSKEIKQMTLDEQLTVATTEFKERTGNWNRFINSTNLNDATDIVWRGYENGGNNSLATMLLMNKVYGSRVLKQWNERIRFAQQISKL